MFKHPSTFEHGTAVENIGKYLEDGLKEVVVLQCNTRFLHLLLRN